RAFQVRSRMLRTVDFLFAMLGLLALPVLLGMIFYTVGIFPVLPALLMLVLIWTWMIFAYLHYRYGRQEEFLQLLITAVEANAPLVPAIRAYLLDRPRGTMREFWVCLLQFFVFPGYYWFWHQRHSFDRKVARVARLLESGVPLEQALQATPGVAARETI